MDMLLDVKGLRVHFQARSGILGRLFKKEKRGVQAVDGIDFSLERGEILCLAGESGCGKTTTGKAVLRLVDATAGEILFEGEDILSYSRKDLRRFRQKAQIIFQDPYESLNPRQTVFSSVAEPLEVNRLCKDLKEKEERVEEALKEAGILDPQEVFYRYPHELSGGQRQRVAIATALVLKPQLIVADEPVSMLDLSIRSGILKQMLELREKKGLSFIFITHDLSLAWLMAHRIAIMYCGRIVELGDAESIIKRPLHPYTKALVSLIPRPGRRRKKRTLLKGEIPDPSQLPPGCVFKPRCPRASKECEEKKPPLKEVEKRHYTACFKIEIEEDNP